LVKNVFIWAAFASLVFMAGCAMTGMTTQPKVGQTPQTFRKKVSKTIRCQYLLFLPKNYKKSDAQFPLIIFLHGAGERGNNLTLVKRHGIPKIVAQKPDFPFIAVSPQCPENRWWSLDTLDALFDEIVSKYRVDRNRIYLTGLSMGGYATWAWAIEHPERFAAIAPICGGGNPLEVYKIKDVPVWAFHGAQDRVVPVHKSEEMIAALKACGENVRLTVYPTAEHDSWTATYDNPELYEWFLKQKKQ